MRLTLPLPDSLMDLRVEVYHPDEETLVTRTDAMAGVRKVRVKLPAEPEECLIRVFPVQNSEQMNKGWAYWEGHLCAYRPEVHTLSTAGASIIDEPVESVEKPDEPSVDEEEEVLGPALDMGEPLELDSSPGLSVVTDAGIQPLEDDEPAESEDETDE
jgi:hypothetical protein